MLRKNKEKIGAAVLALFAVMATVQGAEESFLPILEASKKIVSEEGRPKISAFDQVVEGAQHKTLVALGEAASLEADINLYEWVCLAIANDVPNHKFVGYESSRATDHLCAFLQKHAQSNAVIQDCLRRWLDYTPDIEEKVVVRDGKEVEQWIDRNPAGYYLAVLRILHASRAISISDRCALIGRIDLGYSHLPLKIVEEMLAEVALEEAAASTATASESKAGDDDDSDYYDRAEWEEEILSIMHCISGLLLPISDRQEDAITYHGGPWFDLVRCLKERYPKLARQADDDMPCIADEDGGFYKIGLWR